MRVTPPAEYGIPQVAGVVGEQIQPWITLAQPAREQVNGQRKAVHFRQQCHQEARERAKRTPVTGTPRCVKLKAKMIQTAAFMTTSAQRPEAVVSVCIRDLLMVTAATVPCDRCVYGCASHA